MSSERKFFISLKANTHHRGETSSLLQLFQCAAEDACTLTRLLLRSWDSEWGFWRAWSLAPHWGSHTQHWVKWPSHLWPFPSACTLRNYWGPLKRMPACTFNILTLHVSCISCSYKQLLQGAHLPKGTFLVSSIVHSWGSFFSYQFSKRQQDAASCPCSQSTAIALVM